jgi:hypothetical protein
MAYWQIKARLWLPLLVVLLHLSASAEEKVLSINNSLIFNNGQPLMVEALAASGRHVLKWTARTQLGQSLQHHWDQGTGLDADGQPTARNLIRQGGWTHVILQEFSSRPLLEPEVFFSSVRLFADEIRTFCPDAKLLLFENWPYNTSLDYAADTAALRANYVTIAAEVNATILPVGEAFNFLRVRDGFGKINPYVTTDDRHPSVAGTYYAANIVARMLYRRPAGRLAFYPSDIDESTARLLQKRAKQAIKRSKFKVPK